MLNLTDADRQALVRYLESEERRCVNQRDQSSPWLTELRRLKQALAPVEFVSKSEAAAVEAGELPAEEATVRFTLPEAKPGQRVIISPAPGWRIVMDEQDAVAECQPPLVAPGQGRTAAEVDRRAGWWLGFVVASALWAAGAALGYAAGWWP